MFIRTCHLLSIFSICRLLIKTNYVKASFYFELQKLGPIFFQKFFNCNLYRSKFAATKFNSTLTCVFNYFQHHVFEILVFVTNLILVYSLPISRRVFQIDKAVYFFFSLKELKRKYCFENGSPTENS